MNHNQKEEQDLFLKTLKFLQSIKYVMTENDMDFMNDNRDRLFNDEVVAWVNAL